MERRMDNDPTFDEWFEKWFSHDLVVSLRELRDEVEGIRYRIEEMEERCPALKGWLGSGEGNREGTFAPAVEIGGDAGAVEANLRYFEQRMQHPVESHWQNTGFSCSDELLAFLPLAKFCTA